MMQKPKLEEIEDKSDMEVSDFSLASFYEDVASVQPIDVPIESLAAVCSTIDSMRKRRIR